jgi:hypothetical protein
MEIPDRMFHAEESLEKKAVRYITSSGEGTL